MCSGWWPSPFPYFFLEDTKTSNNQLTCREKNYLYATKALPSGAGAGGVYQSPCVSSQRMNWVNICPSRESIGGSRDPPVGAELEAAPALAAATSKAPLRSMAGAPALLGRSWSSFRPPRLAVKKNNWKPSFVCSQVALVRWRSFLHSFGRFVLLLLIDGVLVQENYIQNS